MSEYVQTGEAGTWTRPAFDPAAFAAPVGVVWTVTAPYVFSFKWQITNKDMKVAFMIYGTNVAGTLVHGQGVWINIPGGKIAADYDLTVVHLENNGVRTPGIATTSPGSSLFSVSRQDHLNLVPGVLSLWGAAKFEIQ